MAGDRVLPVCPVCAKPFTPRRLPGGKPKVYCSDDCKDRYPAACQALGEKLLTNKKYSIEDALAALAEKKAYTGLSPTGQP